MKKLCVIFTVASLLIAPASLCWADEKKDHVCFRVLDSDKDGMVTLPEFEKYFENDTAKFHDADLDKDGKLTHDEYHDLLGHGSS